VTLRNDVDAEIDALLTLAFRSADAVASACHRKTKARGEAAGNLMETTGCNQAKAFNTSVTPEVAGSSPVAPVENPCK
jgi:hypothetical protein